MKITIEFDNNKLPEPYKVDGKEGGAGLANIFAFLTDKLLLATREKALDEAANARYTKAYFDQGGCDGQAWVNAINKHNDDEVKLAALLMDNLKVEK